nr:solute carrier family 23 protein [Aminipila sp.]
MGFVPFASSMGVIAMTGMASRRPFYLGSAFMIVLGLIAPVGSFLPLYLPQ